VRTNRGFVFVSHKILFARLFATHNMLHLGYQLFLLTPPPQLCPFYTGEPCKKRLLNRWRCRLKAYSCRRTTRWGYIWAPPVEYDWTINAWPSCATSELYVAECRLIMITYKWNANVIHSVLQLTLQCDGRINDRSCEHNVNAFFQFSWQYTWVVYLCYLASPRAPLACLSGGLIGFAFIRFFFL